MQRLHIMWRKLFVLWCYQGTWMRTQIYMYLNVEKKTQNKKVVCLWHFYLFVCFLPNRLQLFEPSGLISHIKCFLTIQPGGKTMQTVPLLGCTLLLFLKGVKVLYEIQHKKCIWVSSAHRNLQEMMCWVPALPAGSDCGVTPAGNASLKKEEEGWNHSPILQYVIQNSGHIFLSPLFSSTVCCISPGLHLKYFSWREKDQAS